MAGCIEKNLVLERELSPFSIVDNFTYPEGVNWIAFL